jgi:signal transduction histidine kinase
MRLTLGRSYPATMPVPRQWRPHRVRSADAVLALVLLGVGQSEVWLGWDDGGIGGMPHGHRLLRALLVVAFTVPLAWRCRRPMITVLTICAAVAVQLLFVAPQVPFLVALVPMAVANYSVAAHAPARVRAAGLLAVFAVEAVIYARVPAERAGGEVLFAAFVALGTWAVGDLVRVRSARADQVADEARVLVVQREAAASAALADERARIARELHDIIAHSVSVMGVQAGAARILLDADPDAARAALCGIEATARTSVNELQRLLAVLRECGGEHSRLPQPGLAQLPALVEQVRAAGLPVQLSTAGAAAALAPGVDLAAYRIVQEALTNALKHAGAPTTVQIRYDPRYLRVEVRDVGTRPERPGNGASHGLIGMRERALLYGGTVEAEPDPAGGFVVRACLPIGTETPAWSAS